MRKERSTLFTSPLSFGDFVFRLAFFSLAPFAIVMVAELFPVRGALVDVGLALSVFVAGEAVKRSASRSRTLGWLLSSALQFESFYREKKPRPFAYYVFYPFLFPYWLAEPRARREFWMFRGYTVGSFLILVFSLVWQYFQYWRPELAFRVFLPDVLLTLLVETLLVLSLLMPIATTVVWYHSSYRRGRLVAVLAFGLASTVFALVRVARYRDPIVSFIARDRVTLRTAAAPARAHAALLEAAHEAWKSAVASHGVEGDGKVEGEPADRAHAALETFYKHDEAYAFDLWASPRQHPRVLVVYFEARRKKPPIWVAITGDGAEIHEPGELPKGAFTAMRRAADTTDAALRIWPSGDDSPLTSPSRGSSRAP